LSKQSAHGNSVWCVVQSMAVLIIVTTHAWRDSSIVRLLWMRYGSGNSIDGSVSRTEDWIQLLMTTMYVSHCDHSFTVECWAVCIDYSIWSNVCLIPLAQLAAARSHS